LKKDTLKIEPMFEHVYENMKVTYFRMT
jgi:hypothetical protein